MRRPVTASRRPGRRGIALVVVMAAIAACLVIAMAFLHAETSALRTLGNVRAADRAREAAESGMAALLSDLQSPTWAGIDTVIAAEIGRDGAGVWTYRAGASPAEADGSVAAALTLELVSSGTYQPLGSPRPIERSVGATVMLVPRAAVDGAQSDLRPDAGWDPVQSYALFAGESMKLPPQAKVVGDAWVFDEPRVYHEVGWSATVRSRAGADRPAPITGRLFLHEPATAGEAANLTALLGSHGWTQASSRPALPAVSPSGFAATQDYRLYEGGPTYRSVAIVGSTLGTSPDNGKLKPTATNPLGIFFRSGDVDLLDDVRVKGTLVATGRIRIRGSNVEIGAVRSPLFGAASLPAVVAGTQVEIEKEASVEIEGLVYAAGGLSREAVDRHEAGRVTIEGAVMAGSVDLGTPPMWQALDGSDWDNRNASCPAGTPFLPWLKSPVHWLLFWPPEYSLFGLSNEPTFLVTRPAGTSYVAAPPLFRPDPSAWDAGGGYRWSILSWHDLP